MRNVQTTDGQAARVTTVWPCVTVLLIAMMAPTQSIADVVITAPTVTTRVIVRAKPAGDPISSLLPGEGLELVGEAVPTWREVRLGDGRQGFVSNSVTRIIRLPRINTAIQSERLERPIAVEITQLPNRDPSSNIAQIQIAKMPDARPVLGIRPEMLPLGSVVVAGCSVLILLYSGLLANIRSRTEAFRVLRERFETLRNETGVPEAWAIKDFDVASGKMTKEKVLGDLDATAKAEGWAALENQLRKKERYWVRAFDEWYITTGGWGVRKQPSWRLTKGLRRLMGVNRPLWDDYYRDALANTIHSNPTLLAALLSAYGRTDRAPKATDLDTIFLDDMWHKIPADPDRVAALEQLAKLNAWRGCLVPPLAALVPPTAR